MPRPAIFRLISLLALALALRASASAQAAQITASEACLRVQQHYAATPAPDTVDTLKAGDPATLVTGIATTFLDTMAVLREAVQRGDNLILTHEPTFYNHRDDPAGFRDDPVYREKLAYIQEHHLIVYRLHDAIHDDPNGDHILEGLYSALGWQHYPHSPGHEGQFFVTIPPTTFRRLAITIQQRLHAKTMRIVGDPALSVTHIALLPGAAGLTEQVAALNAPGVQVLIAGEAREWETVEYVRDAVAQGRPIALMLLDHQVSEEPGMEQCAQDLRSLFPGLRIDHLIAGQPLRGPTSQDAPARLPHSSIASR